MARLLVVHHTTSPHLQAMFEAVMSGATDEAIEGVTVLARPALNTAAMAVAEAPASAAALPRISGVEGSASSLKLWNCSNAWPHSVQAYW